MQHAPKFIKFKGAAYRLAVGAGLSDLTPEQAEAIEQYAAWAGRSWKMKLHKDWQRAKSDWPGNYALLQQVRNQFGSGWLAAVKLQRESFPPESRYPEKSRTGEVQLPPAVQLVKRINDFVLDRFDHGVELESDARYQDLVDQFVSSVYRLYRELFPLPKRKRDPAAPPLPRDPWAEETSDPLTGPV